MSRSRSTSRSDRPVFVVASLWLVALALSVHCGPELRDWVAADEQRESTALAALTDEAVALAARTGALAVHDRLEAVRARLYDREAAPTPAAPAAPNAPAAPALALTEDATATVGSAAVATKAPAAPPAIRRVLIVGASSIQLALGVGLEAELEERGLVVKRFGRAASGLSNPEYLDWPAKLEQLLDGFATDAVIVNFGGNDAQGIKLGRREWAKWGTAAWDEAYAARVADLVRQIRARGAHAFVIGMPIMRSPTFSKRMEHLNQITRDAAVAAGGIYLDQWDLAATPDGKYREEVKLDGRTHLMRDADGIHYSTKGGVFVARGLIPRIEEHVRLAK